MIMAMAKKVKVKCCFDQKVKSLCYNKVVFKQVLLKVFKSFELHMGGTGG